MIITFCITCYLKTVKMNNGMRNALKIVLWIFISCVCFVWITSLSHSHRLPVLTSDGIYVIDYSHQVLPGPYTHVNGLLVQNVSIYNDMRIQRKPKTHVAFLKVHKAGSTTLQNIFFRFGLRHKLNILLPKSGNYLYNHSLKMPLEPGQHYDVFACHTVYSKQWFDSILPPDSVYIGIVREPVSRMISSAYYFRDVWGTRYLKNVPRANFVHNIVNFPEKYDTAFFSHTRNEMGKDFGLPSCLQPENEDKIRNYLDDLNSQFIFVIVMEKINESLVLLKRVLNWSFIDILYSKTNSYRHRLIVLNETEKAKFRKTSFLDFKIYEYFFRVLETKIRKADYYFFDEVIFFNTTLNRVSEFCSKCSLAKEATLFIQGSKWDSEFEVSNSDCKWMKTKELPFIDKLRKTHVYSR